MGGKRKEERTTFRYLISKNNSWRSNWCEMHTQGIINRMEEYKPRKIKPKKNLLLAFSFAGLLEG